MAYSRCFRFNFSLEFARRNDLRATTLLLRFAKFALFGRNSCQLARVLTFNRFHLWGKCYAIRNGDRDMQFALVSNSLVRSRTHVSIDRISMVNTLPAWLLAFSFDNEMSESSPKDSFRDNLRTLFLNNSWLYECLTTKRNFYKMSDQFFFTEINTLIIFCVAVLWKLDEFC